MIESRVEEYTTIIPRARFDANSFMNETALAQRFVRDRDGCKIYNKQKQQNVHEKS